jgi:HTH-type transcriptional regulator/antitoxin HigA
VDAPDPIATIVAHMEWNGYSQADLAHLLGSRSRASEVLARKRALTLGMVHKLEVEWGIPAGLLVKPYALAAA